MIRSLRLLLSTVSLVPTQVFGQTAVAARSFLETVAIHDGQIETVHVSEQHIEAPNWSPDGRFLIVNGGGRLYRLSSGSPMELQLIETGFAAQLNNDHGISPDGSQLVISSYEADEASLGSEYWRTSTIYILPFGGSTSPRRITPRSPSFWHGWSPDGATLAYTALRENEWDIYTISAEGGVEQRLTNCPGLDDGPDYSPDGHYIYFNSLCSGSMEIWRMRVDGSESEQLTDDSLSNWFPHPSPDGRWVAFLSYLQDQGAGHPFGREVRLRLLNLQDGSIRDLTPSFIGGQGTINVPSWSPDSRKVAFVRYEIR